MSKCKKCGRHGLFLMVNVRTGLCASCQKDFGARPAEPIKPIERTIEIPTVYIGNCMKSRLIEKFEDVELQRPDSLPDFSKIECCDDVHFVIENNVVVAKHLNEILGFVRDANIASNIMKSLDEKRPIFSQILGYDDETGEIHLVIAFYRIVNYDYNQFTEDGDQSLEFETVGYY